MKDDGEDMGEWMETLGDLIGKQMTYDSVILDARRSVTARSTPTKGGCTLSASERLRGSSWEKGRVGVFVVRTVQHVGCIMSPR